MRALSILLTALVLLGLSSACYTDAPPRLPEVAELGLVPLTPPDRERGQTLFAEHCAACHGDTGRGDGWKVAELKGPRPRNFHDAKMVETMSPARAYLAISQGVPRTEMSAFELLSGPDRWHLAFHILALGHTEEAAQRGREIFAGLALALPTPRSLSELSNKKIIDDLLARKVEAASARQVLAYLRREATFAPPTTVLAPARMAIVDAIAEYRKGMHARAKTDLQAAHLDQLESMFKILREIEDRAQILFASLDKAEPILSQPLSAGIAVAQSASIALSFALDGALCLFILIVVGSRRGADRRERKSVGLGVLIGMILAVAIWLGWHQLSGMFPGSMRTTLSLLMSTTVALVCAPLLVATTRYFYRPPQTRLHAAPSWLVFLFVMACGILVRDALEAVPALVTIASFSPAALLGFLGAGIAIIALVGLLVAMERRLAVTARVALLCMSVVTVSVIAAGNAARSAQDLGLIASNAAGHVQSPWLAFWPSAQGVLAQLCVATACVLALAVSTFVRHERGA